MHEIPSNVGLRILKNVCLTFTSRPGDLNLSQLGCKEATYKQPYHDAMGGSPRILQFSTRSEFMKYQADDKHGLEPYYPYCLVNLCLLTGLSSDHYILNSALTT